MAERVIEKTTPLGVTRFLRGLGISVSAEGHLDKKEEEIEGLTLSVIMTAAGVNDQTLVRLEREIDELQLRSSTKPQTVACVLGVLGELINQRGLVRGNGRDDEDMLG